ncbi:MAG: aldolase/citrate lyase family protein [Lachnospiraceae bacterium]|nr:aldolase/citrate lyase family protein [Lachnospiraceae bacterium]
MECRAQEIRKKLRAGELVVGGHTFYTDPAITASLGYQGFDFVWIDDEHAAFDKANILNHIVAADSAKTASIVRLPWNDPVIAKPILEMGPDGIIFPMICSADEAKKAVAGCLYPPKGIRGFGPKRSSHYGAIPTKEYLKQAEDSFLRIVQIEHIDAVENLEEILQVEGVDLALVGPNDLSASIGHLGETRHEDVVKLYEQIIATCKKMKKPFGVSVGANDTVAIAYWIENGVSFIGCGDDISYICKGSQETFAYVAACKKCR